MEGAAAMVLRADCTNRREVLDPKKGGYNILQSTSEDIQERKRGIGRLRYFKCRTNPSPHTRQSECKTDEKLPGAWQYVSIRGTIAP
jgi:hypothetical protein